jgi:hypothetical protein
MSATLGIANSLWWRAQWMLIAATAYLCVLAAGVQFFPEAASVFCTGALALLFVWANLLTTFTFGPADFGSKNSGFPTHMLVLPMRTRSLVGWPMFHGIATSACLWWLVTGLVLMPGGLHAPILWPAVLFAASTVWVQALAWSPFPSPWIRAPLVMLAIVPIALLAVWAGMEGHNRVIISFISAIGIVWAIVAYAVGVHGLSKARCGNQPDWYLFLVRHTARWLPRQSASRWVQLAPFRSAAAAQFWHEFRRNAIGVPVLVALASLTLIGVLTFSLTQPDRPHDLVLHSTVIKSEILTLGTLIFFPLLMVGMAGAGMGKFDYWGKDRMPTFFAARPMTTLQYVLLKLKAAAVAAIASWGIMLILLAMWAALDASPLNRHESLVRAAWAQATPRSIAAAVLCCVGLLLLIWRGMVMSFWIALAGRKWFSTMVGVSLPLAVFLCLPGAAFWIFRQPELRERIVALAPWIVSIMAVIKLCAASIIGLFLRRLGLLSLRALMVAFAVWVVVAGYLLAAIGWFVPLTPLLAAAVILFVPLTRLAAAPLTLHWNRHR